MIKKTFYNLPKEKRDRIIAAVMNEFSSSSTEKVSINRIIKAADISRGSFYQYFDDKVDLVEVLIKFFLEHTEENMESALLSSNGDIFYTYLKIFDVIVDLANDSKQKLVLKNLVKNLHANSDLISEYMLNRFDGVETLRELSKRFNTENLRFKNSEDVYNLSQILMLLLKNAVFDVFVTGISREKARSAYSRNIEIIKAGAIL